jgi:DNA polymerase elongation subunit (family B)
MSNDIVKQDQNTTIIASMAMNQPLPPSLRCPKVRNRRRDDPAVQKILAREIPLTFRVLEQSYSDRYNAQLKSKEGVIELYGCTWEGVSVQVDVPYLLYFYLRLPRGSDKSYAQRVVNDLQWELPENVWQNSVLKWELVWLLPGQRFDLLRDYPYIKLFFRTQQAFRDLRSAIENYKNPKDGREGILTDFISDKNANININNRNNNNNNNNNTSLSLHASNNSNNSNFPTTTDSPLPNELKLLMFEARMSPVDCFNSEYFNPVGWLTIDKFEQVPYAVHVKTTTVQLHVSCRSVQHIAYDANRVEIPTIVGLSYDIECATLDPMDSQAKVFSIAMLFFVMGGPTLPEGVLPAIEIEWLTWQPSAPIDGVKITQCLNEADLLRTFMRRVREKDVDFFLTQNGHEFDQLYILGRMQTLRFTDEEMAFGKALKQKSRKQQGKTVSMSHPGRLHLDTLKYYKENFKTLKSYKLNAIAQYFFANEEIKKNRETLTKAHQFSHSVLNIRSLCWLLPETMLINQKIDLKYDQIPIEYLSGDPIRVAGMGRYNIIDVILPYRFLFHHNILPNILAFALVDRVPPAYITCRGQEIRCMGYIWTVLKRKGMIFNKYYDSKDDQFNYSLPYEGALLQTPIKGLWDVAVLDFASMYPSIMIEYNICKASVIEKRFLTKADYKEILARFVVREETVHGHELVIVQSARPMDEVVGTPYEAEHRRMFQMGYDQRISYIPEIQEDLAKLRKHYKQLMEKYDPEHENDPVLYAIYNALQNAVKVQMNSLYGLNGNMGPCFASAFDIMLQEFLAKMYNRLNSSTNTSSTNFITKAGALSLFGGNPRSAEDLTAISLDRPLNLDAESIVKQIKEAGGEVERQEDVDDDTSKDNTSKPNNNQFVALYSSSKSKNNNSNNNNNNNNNNDNKNMDVEDNAPETCTNNDAAFQFKNTKGSEGGSKSGGGMWPFWPVAALITYFGRKVITGSKEYVLRTYPGTVVPYGDTDSLMIRFPVERRDFASDLEYRTRLFEIGKEAATGATAYWKQQGKGKLKFELEKILAPFALTDLKKKYFGWYWESPSRRKAEPKISGLEIVKCDRPKILQQLQLKMVNQILEGVPPEQVIAAVKQVVLDILHGKYTKYEDFAIFKTLSRDLKDYNGNPEHLAVIRRNVQLGISTPFRGEEVSFGYFKLPGVNLRKCQAGQIVRDIREAKELQLRIFYEYYLSHNFRNPILLILSIIRPKDADKLYESWCNGATSLFATFGKSTNSNTNAHTQSGNVTTSLSLIASPTTASVHQKVSTSILSVGSKNNNSNTTVKSVATTTTTVQKSTGTATNLPVPARNSQVCLTKATARPTLFASKRPLDGSDSSTAVKKHKA